jgi:ATP-binding cassette subfamily F protein 3
MPLLSLSRVAFDYGRERLFRDVTLDIEPGEKAALVGINGSGKSTLFRIIAGKLQTDAGERHLTRRARVVLLPQETAAEGEGTLLEWVSQSRRELDRVRSELDALNARIHAGEVLEGDELENYGDLQHEFELLGGYEHESTVEAALLGLGFSRDDLQKPLHVLSGGERRRAALASVLVQGGDLLLLDEPTNHLDLDALEWLQNFVQQSRSAMLIISHDRYFLDHTVSCVWHLSRNTTMRWPGNYTKFRELYEDWIVAEETAYNRQQHEIRKTEDFIRRNIAGQKTKQAQSRRKQLERLERIERPREEQTRFTLRLQTKKRGGNVVLSARGLTKKFGERTLFSGIDIDVARGDKIGIVGPNGAGKTTLLKILARRLTPDAGSVRVGSEIDMGYFDQELDFVGDAPTLMEEIWRLDRGMKEEQVRTVLGAFGFGVDFVDRPVRVLSGGQKSRLGLLKLVLEQHNFLVLDEPTNHLDLDSVGLLEDGLRAFDGTILLVSHDRTLLSRAVRTLIVLTGGRARLFHGGYEEYVSSLGGKPLWSQIEAMEARRTLAQEALPSPTPAARATPAKAATNGDSPADAVEADGKIGKNTITRLKKRLEDIETEIASLEVDVEEIEAMLADPASASPVELQEASRKYAETKKALDTRYAAWEETSNELEYKNELMARQKAKKR